jgi:hypothetical protein
MRATNSYGSLTSFDSSLLVLATAQSSQSAIPLYRKLKTRDLRQINFEQKQSFLERS